MASEGNVRWYPSAASADRPCRGWSPRSPQAPLVHSVGVPEHVVELHPAADADGDPHALIHEDRIGHEDGAGDRDKLVDGDAAAIAPRVACDRRMVELGVGPRHPQSADIARALLSTMALFTSVALLYRRSRPPPCWLAELPLNRLPRSVASLWPMKSPAPVAAVFRNDAIVVQDAAAAPSQRRDRRPGRGVAHDAAVIEREGCISGPDPAARVIAEIPRLPILPHCRSRTRPFHGRAYECPDSPLMKSARPCPCASSTVGSASGSETFQFVVVAAAQRERLAQVHDLGYDG